MIRSMTVAACLALAMALACEAGRAEAAAPATREEAALVPADVANLGHAFVIVRFYFKRNLEEAQGDREDFGRYNSDPSEMYESFISAKKPLTLVGIAVAPDRIATLDLPIDDKFVERIEVADLAGGTSPARRDAILRDRPGMLFAVQKPAGLKIAPLAFAAFNEALTTATALRQVSLAEKDVDYVLEARPVRAGLHFTPEGTMERYLETSVIDARMAASSMASMMRGRMWAMMASMGADNDLPSPAILLDGQRRPIGVIFTPQMRIGGDGRIEGLGNPVQMPSLAIERLDAMRHAAEAQFKNKIAQVRIYFRQKAEPQRGDYMDFDITEMIESRMSGEVPKEVYLYGVPVGADLLFVPRFLPRAYARMIDRITVTIGGQELKGKFAGAFKDVGAFLVRTETKLPPAAADLLSSATVTQYRPMLTASISRRMGGMHLKTSYSRLAGRDRGYRDAIELVPAGDCEAGTIFTDLDGRIEAMLLQQRRENEAKEKFRESGEFGAGFGDGMQRFYPLAEISGLWQAPQSHLDPAIAALSEEEAKRRLWFGATCDSMTKELAEGFHIEKQTKDGQVGMMVTLVYAGSPADKMGLKQGDILLSLREQGDRDPIELKMGDRYSYDYTPSDVDVPKELQNVGFKMPRKRPWKSQANLITRLLDVFGEGATVELTYLDAAHNRQTKSFTIEKAPYDYDNTPRFKHDASGLTVREMTYEVRQALNLPADLKCLVVSDVQDGSPAAVAKIERYDLILKIDGQDVPDIAAFKKVMKQAVANHATLRLNLQYLDKTRATDLSLQ